MVVHLYPNTRSREVERAQQHSVSQWEWCTGVCELGLVAEGVAQTLMVPSPAFSLHPAPVTLWFSPSQMYWGRKGLILIYRAPYFGSIQKWTATVTLTGVILKGSGKGESSP